jgi:hypothetical protein
MMLDHWFIHDRGLYKPYFFVSKDRKGLDSRKTHSWWTFANIPGLVNKQFAIENCPVEIVDLPINKMVDLSSSFCERLPEGRPKTNSHNLGHFPGATCNMWGQRAT